MGKTKKLHVTESVLELKKLLPTTKFTNRIKMLILIKENEDMTLSYRTLSKMLGSKAQEIAKWCKLYETGGISSILEDKRKSRTLKRPENTQTPSPENRLAAIIDSIMDNARISMLELSRQLDVNQKTIKRDIQKLKEKGIIERIGPDKGGYWKVCREAPPTTSRISKK